MNASITVSTGPLSPADVVRIARGDSKVILSEESLAALESSRAVIDALATDTVPHYGVSTGFGALATKQIPVELRAQLQRSLIRSHAASSGAEVPREVVRALMLNRLSTLATGRTGVRPIVAQTYAAVLNAGITPHHWRIRLPWMFRGSSSALPRGACLDGRRTGTRCLGYQHGCGPGAGSRRY